MGPPPPLESGPPMVTFTVADSDPPTPSQVSVKLASSVSGPTVSVPLRALEPDQSPEAVHSVALLLVQLSALVSPSATEAGSAVSVTCGGGGVVSTSVP